MVVSSVNVVVVTILVNGFVMVVTKLVVVVGNISNNDVSTAVLVPVIVAVVALTKFVERSDIVSMTLNVYGVVILVSDAIIEEIPPLADSVSLELLIDIDMLVVVAVKGVVEAMLDLEVIDGFIAFNDVVGAFVITVPDSDNTVELISIFGNGSVVESVAIVNDGVEIVLVRPVIDGTVVELVMIGIDGVLVVKLVVVLLFFKRQCCVTCS